MIRSTLLFQKKILIFFNQLELKKAGQVQTRSKFSGERWSQKPILEVVCIYCSFDIPKGIHFSIQRDLCITQLSWKKQAILMRFRIRASPHMQYAP